ncbi:MAG TPA: polyprenyl synthetase family protein [Candidatus Acetothermia bacterium]|nr:polyprenyl synthetase family protein [Candidatus Acetothermia bacterium]
MVEILTRYRDEIVAALERALAQDGPLTRLLRYPLGLEEPDGTPGPGIGGKLLRPSLVCFSCEALEGDVSAALPLACALELVHNFSLVHDDIQDGDELRRGRPTVWKAFGTAQAINSGDGLLVLALKTAIGAQGALSPKAVLTALEALSSATFRMIEGQTLDLGLEGDDSGGVAEYLAMARRKTGALFGAAFELGAIAAGRPELGSENRELGETLGLAFQITDDILGIWGKPEQTGKPARSDLVRRKHSWPVAYALEQDPTLGELLSRSPVPVEKVLERLSALGVRRAAEEAARRYAREARDKVEALPWTREAKEMFEELLSFLAEREV